MLIAITGGIGAGKSVVSSIVRALGYPVYDCDNEAKRLMVTSAPLVKGIKELLGDDAYFPDGSLNKAYVSSRIFSNPDLMASVNALVHPAVLRDIERWAIEIDRDECFVETALLHESNMTSIIDSVWTVTAPIETRIARVMKRNSMSEEQVRERISNQSNDCITNAQVIINDNVQPVIPQVLKLLLLK